MLQTEIGEVAERCGEAKHRFIPSVVQRRNKFAVVPEFTVVAAGALVVFPSVPSVSFSSRVLRVLCMYSAVEDWKRKLSLSSSSMRSTKLVSAAVPLPSRNPSLS